VKAKLTKVMSILLACVLLLYLLPLQTMAAEQKQTTVDNATLQTLLETSKEPSSQTQTEPQIVSELKESRSEYQKEFLLTNGQRMINVYPAPVHYEENGEWKEIDNTLRTATSGGQPVYENTAGVWQVKLPAKLNGKSMVEVNRDGCTLQFSFMGQLSEPL